MPVHTAKVKAALCNHAKTPLAVASTTNKQTKKQRTFKYVIYIYLIYICRPLKKCTPHHLLYEKLVKKLPRSAFSLSPLHFFGRLKKWHFDYEMMPPTERARRGANERSVKAEGKKKMLYLII